MSRLHFYFNAAIWCGTYLSNRNSFTYLAIMTSVCCKFVCCWIFELFLSEYQWLENNSFGVEELLHNYWRQMSWRKILKGACKLLKCNFEMKTNENHIGYDDYFLVLMKEHKRICFFKKASLKKKSWVVFRMKYEKKKSALSSLLLR